MEQKEKATVWDVLTVVICFCLLAGFGAAIFLLPQKSFSEAENRSLATFPRLTWKSVISGTFSQRVGNFYTDQFPLRREFTGLKATLERLGNKCENNGILFGKDGYLIARDENSDTESAERVLRDLAAFRTECEAMGIPADLCVVPDRAAILTEYLPAIYAPPSDNWGDLQRLTDRVFPGNIALTDVFSAAVSREEEIFYRTDHHWTTDGAYLAYCALAPSLGFTPYDRSYFTPTVISESFLGSAYAKSGLLTAKADCVTLYRYAGDLQFTVVNEETKAVRSGFYDFSALQKRDHYSVFLGGNFATLTITEPASTTPKPRLLLIKDSYANALIPFLSLHFDLTVIDPRYHTVPLSLLLSSTIQTNQFSHALILLSQSTLSGGFGLQ